MDTLFLRYMMAHLRMHGANRPEQWEPDDIVEMFAILPPPAVTFQKWCAILSGPAKCPEPGTEKKIDEMTDEEMAAANAKNLPNFINGLTAGGIPHHVEK